MNNAMLQLIYTKGPYSGLFPDTFNINSGYKKADLSIGFHLLKD